MQENLNFIIEILGTISFAMSGAFAAMQKRFDVFGVLIIAFVTSVGGGTIRDLLLDQPVFWTRDIFTCGVIFLSTLVAIFVKSIEKNFKVTLFLFDSIGLGLFTIIGIQKGLTADLHPIICITLGTITGCFGGIIRDILLNRIPLIFRKEIYATACIVGGAVFIILEKYSNFTLGFAQISTIAVIFTIRTLALKYDWQMPKIYSYQKNDEG
ncbi:trimeric intracellular cation channel family protein [Frigoriflavimonas asaccharolytica]|uniref:trimeric intracellular cation channel family protein n=1 Tax=Frigoriflavimonas asaccharolytica TaxID=2735899 RepID=UPI0015714281|nr:TRIC cation channel family protein [Frigoriflavimonas asaccharolytica]